MACSDLFCSCCRRAYAAGLSDGLKIGYQAGFGDGYVSGYVAAAKKQPPLLAYQSRIESSLGNRLACGCYLTCTCAPVLPASEPQKLAGTLACGCFVTCRCTSRALLPSLESPKLLGTRFACGCYGICNCRKVW